MGQEHHFQNGQVEWVFFSASFSKAPFYSTGLRNGCWLGAQAFIGNNKGLFRNDFYYLWSIWGLQAIEMELSRRGVTGEEPKLILAVNMAILQSPAP